jgi:phosphohistidine swiveling domain-containing protein
MKAVSSYFVPGVLTSIQVRPPVSLVGGKGRGLFFIRSLEMRGQLQTAPFGVVSTEAFRDRVSSRPSIAAQTAVLDRLAVSFVKARLSGENDRLSQISDQLRETSEGVRQKVDTGLLDHDLAVPLMSFGRASVLPGCGLWALRSSVSGGRARISLDEDSRLASFSGQYDSRIGITPEEAPEALVDVWRSLYKYNAVIARNEASAHYLALLFLSRGQDFRRVNEDMLRPFLQGCHSEPAMAGIIQTMIDGVAGNCYSIDPGTRRNGSFMELSEKGSDVVDGETAVKNRVFIDPEGNISPPDFSFISPGNLLRAHDQAQILFSAARGEYNYPLIDSELALDQETGRPYFIQVRPYLVSCINPAWEVIGSPELLYQGGLPIVQRPASGRLLVRTTATEADEQALRRDLRSGQIVVTDKFHANVSDLAHALGGMVAEMGGPTCHAANVANQNGIPCLVGAPSAVEKLRPFDGQLVTLFPSLSAVFLGEARFQKTLLAGRGLATANINIANARPDLEERGRTFFGKPRFPMTGFQLHTYLRAFDHMNRYIREFFPGAGEITYLLRQKKDQPDDGLVIYAPIDEIGQVGRVIRNSDLDRVRSWLNLRKQDSRRFFEMSGRFSLTPQGFEEICDLYARAVGHFHLRGTVLHALEARSRELLPQWEMTPEIFKNLQNLIFGQGREIETRRFHSSFVALFEKAWAEPVFKAGLPALDVLEQLAVHQRPILDDLRKFSQEFMIVNTEDIRLTPETPALKVTGDLLRAVSEGRIQDQPANDYVPFVDLLEILSRFKGSGELAGFLEFTRLMYELNFENELEHHGQPRAQWRLVNRLKERFPDLDRWFLELSVGEIGKKLQG